jgi:hypothetical protein
MWLSTGGVPSPLLGNCNCFVQGFADDIVILISGKFLSTICDLMQRALNCVQNWCVEKVLNVNANKTSMVLFTKRGIWSVFLLQNHLTRS